MDSREQIVTYWLCPAEPARNRFAEIIRNLAAQFDAPVFEPHVTIHVTNAERENPQAVLERVLKVRRTFRLTVTGIDSSAKFTKTLFVQFASDPDLARLSEDLRRGSSASNHYQLNPHLSLLYKEMDQETKRRLATSIVLPFSEVFFDVAKAVISPTEIKSRKEVQAWRVVAERKLSE